MSANLYAVVDRLPYNTFYRLVVPRGMTGADAGRLARATLREYLGTFAGRKHATWQSAWNEMTGARPDQPGVLDAVTYRCEGCHGRGYTTNGSAMVKGAAMGYPMGTCPECRGSGKSRTTHRMTALFADAAGG